MKQDGRFSKDPRGYMRRKNAARRARCLAAGICPACASEPARPGLKTCGECSYAQKIRKARSIA